LELSPSFLSQLENGKTAPSLHVLDKICTFFSLHIATLFETEGNKGAYFHFKKESQIELEDENRSLRFLLPKSIHSFFEPLIVFLKPGARNQNFSLHQGIEFGYVIEGNIEVHIKDTDKILCKKGDSIYYPADSFHKLVNPTDKISQGIWINIYQEEENNFDFPHDK